MKKTIYKIKGMDCPSCAQILELDLEDAKIKASCNFPSSTLEVECKNNSDSKKVQEILKKSGYTISS